MTTAAREMNRRNGIINSGEIESSLKGLLTSHMISTTILGDIQWVSDNLSATEVVRLHRDDVDGIVQLILVNRVITRHTSSLSGSSSTIHRAATIK